MFRAYGENGFTFLFFQKLFKTKQIVNPFLKNLKQFSTGKNLKEIHKKDFSEVQKKEKLEVWLFPNFGKSAGFGEPDAIILYRGFSFWIEVETQFNLIKKETEAKKALRQLMRFHYFNQALANGKQKPEDTNGESYWVIKGPTISGKGTVKDGRLRVKGHKVLKELLGRLIESAKNKNDHYILLSIGKMELKGKLNEIFNGCIMGITDEKLINLKPCSDRFWYQYYEGDLKNITKINLPDYVSRKSS